MTDIAKAALAGAWTLVVGWILPTALGLAALGVFVLPSVRGVSLVRRVLDATASDQALSLLVFAVLIGLTLSVLSTPLYRILEGYTLWPVALQEWRIRHHATRRGDLRKKVRPQSSGGTGLGVRDALALEEFHRYPDAEQQIAPTLLGNAIRRFEYYSFDRYQLDSQLLWSQLRGVVAEGVAKEVDNARAEVDFCVCLCYVSAVVALASIAALFSPSRNVTSLVVAIVLGVACSIGSYRAAIKATDGWSSAVRAMVDLGRVPLAKALGLVLPQTLEEERAMWLTVGWVLGFAHDPKGKDALDPYRIAPPDPATREDASVGGAVEGASSGGAGEGASSGGAVAGTSAEGTRA